jgi:signal transduction histidine kinase/ligand-binding sensor domain-containing protein
MIWFLSGGGKLGRFGDDHFEILDSPPGLTGKKIQSVARDEAGRIWVGTDVELARWEHGAFTNCSPAGPAGKISVRRIMPVPGERLWLEVDDKLVCRDHGQWSPPVAEWDGRTPWSQLRTFRADNSGGLWLSLVEGMAHLSRDGQLVRVTSTDGLPSQPAQTVCSDQEGNLWAGYHRGGLIGVRPSTFHAMTRREGLRDTMVTSVTEDSAGAIWIGTAGGSVARWADGLCTNYTLPLHGRFCQDVVVAAGPDGRVWIGTGGNGLLVWNHGQFQAVLSPDQISTDGVRQLLATQNGEVWFANFSGLYRLMENKPARVLTPYGTAQAVAALKEGPDGSLWIGTIGGALQCWKGGKLSSFQPQDNVPSSRFCALWPEADGTVWIGTMTGGLLRFKDGLFTRFNTKDGLADTSISHILADEQGNLWLGCHAGVMCIAQESLVPRLSRTGLVPCRLFGRSDGLPTVALTLEFQPSCVKTRDGMLWFGSPKGASWVDPRDVRPPESAPPVLVESVRADNQVRDFSPPDSTSAMPELTVEPGVNNLEVRFTSPVFTAPELMRFKYRLDKLDADWIDLGGQRSVTFTHLSAGEYTFNVMAGNSDGRWSQQPAAFRLIVQPHYWERTSFRVAMLFALLGGVALIVRRLTQQRLRRKLETLRQQQQIDRERARIAQDLHDDLGAGLTEIRLTSAMSANPNLAEYESREYAREVSARAAELVQRMDEIVWAVNPRNDSIISLSYYACQYAEQILKPLGMACRLDVQPGLPEISLNAEQRYNFFLAFKEAIANIAKHSNATELKLAIKVAGDQFVFELEDNGRGFVPGGEHAGADGLRNIRERIARLGGESEITSEPGQGTRVFLRVPIIVEPAKA